MRYIFGNPLFFLGIVTFTVIYLTVMVLLLECRLKKIKKKSETLSFNFINYTSNENDIIEEISNKIKNLEFYTAQLEVKITTLTALLKNKPND